MRTYVIPRSHIRNAVNADGITDSGVSRKRLGAMGLSMVKLINADEKTLRDVYCLPAAVIERLQEAFRALGVEKGIRRDELHAMGSYTFEDFAPFRKSNGR